MTMSGKGGGVIYVPLLAMLGMALDDAVATSQIIIVLSASASMIVFSKKKVVDWKLILIAEPATAVAALTGGYLSSSLPPIAIKTVFITSILASLLFMKRRAFVKSQAGGLCIVQGITASYTYTYSVITAVCISATAGFIAGLTGIAGGALKVPLFIGLCGIPPVVAIGSSSIMILITSISSVLGQMAHGNIDFVQALPFAAAAIAGNLVGSRISVNIKQVYIIGFIVFTSLVAVVLMLIA